MRATRAATLGLVLAVLIVALAFAVPALLDWEVHSRTPASARPDAAPPLHGWWEPQWVGPGTLPAVLLAILGWRYAGGLAERLPWRQLLAMSYAAGLVWLVSLAVVDGSEGLSRVLGNRFEYLRTAREVDDVPALLAGYVDRIPIDSADNWPIHVAGHPPGALLFFVGLVRVGLGGDLAAGLVVVAIAASIPLAVLTALRALDAEESARRSAPFLVLTPAAVFLAVSADALFATIGCWGVACLALAVRADRNRQRPAMLGWGAGAGLLFGYGVFCTYGFGMLGAVALAVLVAGRSWRPAVVLVVPALVVTGVFAWLGFAWWKAFPVLRERYWDGIAADRPASYWLWANLAALLISSGPLIAAGLAHAAAIWRTACRPTLLLAAGGTAAVAAADLSGMSKAEVERIWLLFVPWLTVTCALLPEQWRRWGLGLQVAAALLVQHPLIHELVSGGGRPLLPQRRGGERCQALAGVDRRGEAELGTGELRRGDDVPDIAEPVAAGDRRRDRGRRASAHRLRDVSDADRSPDPTL